MLCLVSIPVWSVTRGSGVSYRRSLLVSRLTDMTYFLYTSFSETEVFGFRDFDMKRSFWTNGSREVGSG